jgi:low affinity Fe/Cu permease
VCWRIATASGTLKNYSFIKPAVSLVIAAVSYASKSRLKGRLFLYPVSSNQYPHPASATTIPTQTGMILRCYNPLNNNNMKTAKKEKGKKGVFDKFSSKVTAITGSSWGFVSAFLVVIVWAACGPFFKFSETWQLVINTGTTIITFLMVFVIQKSQNRDSLAIQLKLNELVAAHEFASNRLVNVESLTEEEMKVIQKYYLRLSDFTKKDESLQQSHSIDEAEENHEMKKNIEKGIMGNFKK